MEIFLKVLSIDPNHVAALINMSYCHCIFNRYEDALNFMNKAIEIDTDCHTYMHRATIKKKLVDIEGAMLDEEAAWAIGHVLPF